MARKFVLSLDGGGIRGIVPGVVLAEIERRMAGKRIAEVFDLIAGTSTGGILALGSAVPGEDGHTPRYSSQDLLKLYTDHGERLFTRQLWDQIISGMGSSARSTRRSRSKRSYRSTSATR